MFIGLFGCRECARRRYRVIMRMLVLVLVRRMDVLRFFSRLYVGPRRYANENISPHAALRVAANRTEIFVSPILDCLENDLFCIERTGVWRAGQFVCAGSFSNLGHDPELAHDM